MSILYGVDFYQLVTGEAPPVWCRDVIANENDDLNIYPMVNDHYPY